MAHAIFLLSYLDKTDKWLPKSKEGGGVANVPLCHTLSSPNVHAGV